MKSLSVLLADDEESIRVLLEHWLTSAGHTVVAVGNASEAIAAMTQRKFDLLVTDILMPDGDGLDLITELKRSQAGTRILAMSGGGRYIEGEDCLRMARGMGAHAVVTKPFTWERFSTGIEQALTQATQKPWE